MVGVVMIGVGIGAVVDGMDGIVVVAAGTGVDDVNTGDPVRVGTGRGVPHMIHFKLTPLLVIVHALHT
jgi:hypothetical protein